MASQASTTDNHCATHSRHWRLAVWGSAVLLWLLPMLAQAFSREMNWGVEDFAAFGLMLAAAVGACEIADRMWRRNTGDGSNTGTSRIGRMGRISRFSRFSRRDYRAAVGVAVAGAFLMVWVNAAVGIVGEPDHPANGMFLAVLGVGVLGAFASRGRPRGMARGLLAMALTQGLAAVAAALAGWPVPMAASLMFTLNWLLSAWLFRRAALGRAEST